MAEKGKKRSDGSVAVTNAFNRLDYPCSCIPMALRDDWGYFCWEDSDGRLQKWGGILGFWSTFVQEEGVGWHRGGRQWIRRA